jgi:hypothetical protein
MAVAATEEEQTLQNRNRNTSVVDDDARNKSNTTIKPVASRGRYQL